MKKFLTIISLTTLIFLAGCQNTSTTSKNSASDQSKDEKAASASKVIINVSDNKTPPTTDIKKTTVDLGDGLKVEGMVDASIKSTNENKGQPIVTGKKGLIFNETGFLPATTQAKVGTPLIIANNSSIPVTIFTVTPEKTFCKDFPTPVIIGANESITVNLKSAQECTLSNSKAASQKTLISVK